MKIAFVLLVAAVAICSANANRIVGGAATTIDRYPAIVSMERFRFTVWTINCAANIINNEWVVSAAHCLDELPQFVLGLRRIRAGSTYRETGGEVRLFNKVILHPEFDVATAFDCDIALARMAQPLSYTNVIQSIAIPPAGYEILDEQPVVHAGWGATRQGGSGSEILRDVTIYTVNKDICVANYLERPRGPVNVTENMICAGIIGVGGKDACGGDSGGPMYYGGVLIGIISWGEGCAQPNFPGVSTKVSRFTDWILETINNTK